MSLKDLAVSAFGPLAYAVQRLGQDYAVRRELAKADSVGSGVTARPGLFIHNGGKVVIGRNVSFGSGVDIACYPGGSVTIGDDVFVGNGCVIAAAGARIVIGSDCLIAEGVSVRAGDHGLAKDRPMRLQPVDLADVSVGRDVWLAKGVTVLAGSRLADGCVIAANAVARGETEPFGIYAGVPIKKVGERRGPAA